MRRWWRLAAVAAVVLVATPGRALAADVVRLKVAPSRVAYGAHVTVSGSVEPAAAGEAIGIHELTSAGWSLVGNARTKADGTFAQTVTVTAHGVFVARAVGADGGPVDSPPVSVLVRPRVLASLVGSRSIGGRLFLRGTVSPREAGRLTVADGDGAEPVAVDSRGRFRIELTTTRLFSYRVVLDLRPATGYTGWDHDYPVSVDLPPLAVGSHGPAVAWLEHSLAQVDHYALPGVGSRYDFATADAVLAFQNVHGLPRTGSVDARFWQVLRTSQPPLARIPLGDHIEVDKTRQVLFEVRDGLVVSVSHVSTGATGNTPVGHWHVYAKGPGFNAKGMYDSMFFLGGFAIHGYDSVPSYPASHGCVRRPFWFAREIYSRWAVAASVYVFP
jgi:L,D-transpeptidase-like protein/putative peptidoglycan binding protein